MKIKLLLTIISFFGLYKLVQSQTYPTFGAEIKVTINGLTFDAMEPFISPDGNTLFFNSLNAGGNTNLYYATKVNDSTFNFIGLVGGCYDPSPNHLDAVASMDSTNKFYWTSLRSLPNLYTGIYNNGTVSNLTKVYGTCNILSPTGWIIMDAAINYTGDLLYYANAYFGPTYTECTGVPCKAMLGIAQKVNDSTFNKMPNSDAILANINDTNYLVYAPQVSKDGLELYFTRLLKNTTNTEICVSVRNSINDPFSLPTVIYSNNGFFPEAVTITTDKQKIYYHQKDNSLLYNIFLRYRNLSSSVNYNAWSNNIKLYPNPFENIIKIDLPESLVNFEVKIYNTLGEAVFSSKNDLLDLSNLRNGVYILTLTYNKEVWYQKIIKH